MKKRWPVMALIILSASPLLSYNAIAGKIYRCEQPDGSVIYADYCPDDTANKEYKGVTRSTNESPSYRGSGGYGHRLSGRQRNGRQQALPAILSEYPKEFREAEEILSKLPYRRPGDRLKRQSMIEHARVLQNIGRAKLGQAAVPVVRNYSVDEGGYRFAQDGINEDYDDHVILHRTGNDYINRETGNIYIDRPGGVINSETGDFLPDH